MKKKLTRTGNSVALVIDKPLLEQLGLEEGSEVEVSSNGEVILITKLKDKARERKFKRVMDEINREYDGLFQRLSR
jgi:antitoxin component of MazEF toxin-antitoxin module